MDGTAAIVVVVGGLGLAYLYTRQMDAQRAAAQLAGYTAGSAVQSAVQSARTNTVSGQPATPAQKRAKASTWLTVLGGVVSGVGASLAPQQPAMA